MTKHIGFLLFPNVQQLDILGPHDVLAGLPDVKAHLVWKHLEPMRSSSGAQLSADTTLDVCPPLDILVVPGGAGINDTLTDPEVIGWVRRQAKSATYVTSVCTGALLLGVAGLLTGRRATTHWRFHDLLHLFGAVPVRERVVRDDPESETGSKAESKHGHFTLMTGGGVTAGIDFALTLAAELVGRERAEAAQLYLEYAPAPPFASGDPTTAPQAVVGSVIARTEANVAMRREAIVQGLEIAKDVGW